MSFLIVGFVLIIWLISIYNAFIRGRNQVKNAWGQISVQLKRRHDLIPNLVECVKGYMEFEQETLEKVIQARNQALTAGDINTSVQAENALSKSLSGLLAVVERYPDLKASQNMLNLQEELTATENKISFSRQHYNDSIFDYNNKCESFPHNLVAKMFGFTPYAFFEAAEAEKETPQVKF